MMSLIHSRDVIDHVLPSSQRFCDKDELRSSFAMAMSAMYRSEVPLYGDLVKIVRQVNQACNNGLPAEERLDLERHGAIRLGTATELHTVKRVFALIGLHPVDYYDLSVAGLPMHATAFRPVETHALSKNPFRVFTTLLRPELLRPEPRELALRLLNARNIFSNELLDLIEVGEKQGGFDPVQGETFILEALKTFQWHSVAAATHEDYQQLAAEHPILADVACFNNSHINHLTPRVLDIELAERSMREEGLSVKSRIEGPPARTCPILLRQTSFLALQEKVSFPMAGSATLVKGSHKARFGEIEERGAALTMKGRKLYDRVLKKALQDMQTQEGVSEDAYKQTFQQFPDDWETLLREELVYFECRFTSKALTWTSLTSDSPTLSFLLEQGVLKAVPITYEDFLPFSAAGIFQSNLQSSSQADDAVNESFGDRGGLEAALGCEIYESDKLYADMQVQSILKCARTLGVREIVIDRQA